MIDIAIDHVGDSKGPNPVARDFVASLAARMIEAHAAELRAPRFADRLAGILVRDGSDLSDRIERWATAQPIYRRTVTSDVVIFDATQVEREIGESGRPMYPVLPKKGRLDVIVVAGNRPTWASIPAQPSKAEQLLAAVREAHPTLADSTVEDTIAALRGRTVVAWTNERKPYNREEYVTRHGDA